MATVDMNDMINKFSSLTEKPVKYLTVQNELKKDITNLVKSLYDYTKSQEKKGKSKNGALSEIIVEGFDEEQIWQQIEMQNSGCWDQLVWDVANGISAKDDLNFPVQISQPSEEEIAQSEQGESDCDELPAKSTKSTKTKKKKAIIPKLKPKSSIVDDEFFNLQEMEKFLLKEERSDGNDKKKEDSDEESIDMFDDIDDDELDEEGEGKAVKYYDFFADGNDAGYGNEGDEENMSDERSDDEENDDNSEGEENGGVSEVDESENMNREEKSVQHKMIKGKKDKKVRFANESERSDSEHEENETAHKNPDKGNEKDKSEFELRQQRLKDQISRLENKSITDAPWQLKGEVVAKTRPKNSLLEEVVDFDLTTRPAPIITEQTTLTLEDIIKQRVKDKAWDDVVRKEKPVDDQLLFRKPEILDQSKSKLSLAQVYEAEYLKQKQALTGGEEEEKEPESHTEIRDAMRKLFSKLDALCHNHYTPKPPQPEVKIVSNTPAISMEEVAPVATSDAALLAPEEVKKKQRGDLLSKEERTQTDKNRERRKKKQLQRKKGKVMKVTEHRNTTKGTETTDKALKTSKAFFQQLNDDATSIIKTKNKRNVKNKGQ